MSSKIESVSIPRELLERHLLKFSMAGLMFTKVEGLLKSYDELNEILAAPVVERQPLETVAGHHPACRAVDDYKPGDCSHGCTAPPELAELQATIVQLTAENADMQTRLAEACEFIDNPYDKEKLQALIAECRYGVSGKGPAIEVANDLLSDCCDNLESLLKENERLKGGQGEPVLFVAVESIEDPECVGMHATRKANDLQHVPLYTSQPAPVSVVLPLREMFHGEMDNPEIDFNKGWNNCLDKVKELNQ